ncbi:MAG: copper chaperone PCu(A)C [Proteobacteria bacterium]|uniref:copper chaperone PCu(A)C n=1 Tax=Rudaea sp. TaxID=2136325 RepID=UPI001D469CAD|nr:copper chaperone PCu(A)C [Pseudomonadota bacterium]MBS0565808.1 copper chaperone PCu(A)C [Pseudomonadota bacterium]
MIALLALTLTASPAVRAAGRLEITGAWIRTAPPGAMMLAGYATLRNTGDAPLTVTGASSEAFGDVSLHESAEVDGVAHMKALGSIEIAPGASIVFAPGGKHLMLMRPKHEIAPGQSIEIRILTKSGEGASAGFAVGDAAPAANP